MANSLTGLIPTLYQAVDIVSRELVGFIPSVTLDAQAERAAVGQLVNAYQTQSQSATDITPAVIPPDDGDQTIGAVPMYITKAKRVPVRWTGEQTLGVNTGPGQPNILRDQFAQAMRTLTNLIEADLAALYSYASRAWGTPGTALFQNTAGLSEVANVLKILKDNGAPMGDLQLVLNTLAGANMLSLTQLTKANEAGTTELRAQGKLLEIFGFTVRESAQIPLVLAGSGAGYTLNGASIAGQTNLALQAGTGTILPGNLIQFGGDTDKYVVNSPLSAGALSINNPGLRMPLATGNAMTLLGNYTPNLAFARTAFQLATRAPALPPGGDLAIDRMNITDPVSGITFEISMYPQYRQIQYEVAIAWGAACVKPEHTALLIG